MISKSFKYLVVFITLLTSYVLAAPPNTVTLDGRPLEYDDSELIGTNPNLSNNFGAGNSITNLFVTWDSNYVYFALQGHEVNDKLTIMLDVDPTNGTGATTTTNWSGPASVYPDYIRYNDVGWQAAESPADEFGLDYQIASEGFYNNIMRIRYNGYDVPTNTNVDSLFDNGNGLNPLGTPIDMVVRSDATVNPLKGIEARIPWSVLYTNNLFGTVEAGEKIPRGAKLRLFAVLHNNDPITSYSSDGIIPVQTGGALVNGIWTTANYIDVDVDQDLNGLPDLGSGDVNAPYLKYVSGVQSKRQVYAWFSENVESNSAQNATNWRVGNDIPESVVAVQPDAVLLNLTNDLPTAGNLVRVESAEVEDLASNSRTTYNYFDPSSSGTETSITVRFLLNKNSGMGFSSANPRVTTNIFINGGSAPLEFGYPPVKTSPLTMLNSTQYYRDVTFPAGTASKLSYKYSGVLDGGGLATGTNNYEAIRLVNYQDMARSLTLPTNGLITSLVVTDWLGAAAAPYRDPGTNAGYNALYADPRRGDSGVRGRHTVLFQLDLSDRNLQGVTRVLVQGSDPLRGFNVDNSPLGDFAGNGFVGWDVGGIQLFDNGTNGDVTSADGIYSRLWAFTIDGLDVAVVPDSPNSLVGGSFSDLPYSGSWFDSRSPRSFAYKFYVYKGGTDEAYESPSQNIEYYIESGSPTNIVFSPFVWDNGVLPLPPPSNAPTMLSVRYTNGQGVATFDNEVTELQHGFHVATNLVQGWLDFGSRAVTTLVAGVWQLTTANATTSEHYRAFAGPPKASLPWYWQPSAVPSTGGVVRYWYNQHSRKFAGARDVGVTGNFLGWGNAAPATFAGDGWWYYDLVISNTSPVVTEFKSRRVEGTYEDGDNNFVTRGFLRASWTPMAPTNGELFTITYDANGGILAAATNVNAHVGFGQNWDFTSGRKMTNTLGQTNIWEVAFLVPTNISTSINFVFNNGLTWDSPGNGGINWRVFLSQP